LFLSSRFTAISSALESQRTWCRQFPERLEEGTRQEEVLDSELRDSVAEAGEVLADLLEQKERLERRRIASHESQEGLRGEVANLQAAFSELQEKRVR